MVREFKDTFIFRNAVSIAGYEWIKRADGQTLLVMQDWPDVRLRSQELHAGVFREFAELPPTREPIRGFAEKYGDILSTTPRPVVKDENGNDACGTLLSDWKAEIGDMRVLVKLWDHIKERNYPELKKLIWITEDGPESVIGTPKRGDRIHKLVHFSGPIQFLANSVLLPAQCALQIEINTRLSENRTVPELMWTPDAKEPSGGYHQRIVFRPSNLLAAMWIQFAQAVTGEFQLRRCDFCGEYFQVGPGGRRDDATFCKDVCRVKAWVERKNQANQAKNATPKKAAVNGRKRKIVA